MKKTIILAGALVLASVSLSAGGCPQCKARQIQQNRQYNNQQQSNRNNQGDNYGQKDVEAILDVSDRAMGPQDRQVLVDIRSTLQNNGINGEGSGIRLTVNRGRVLVNGLVRDDNQREQIEGYILQVDGVKDVTMDVYIQSIKSPNNTNRAAFKSPQYGQNRNIATADIKKPTNGKTVQINDKELEKSVTAAIKGSWFSKSFPNVTVGVNNGRVLLTGTVKTEQDKVALENKVKSVNGVQGITNQVTIESAKATSALNSKQTNQNRF